MRVKLAYRYCDLDKAHEYHFVITEATPDQTFWFGFHLGKIVKKKVHLYPWIPNWCKTKKLGAWSQASAEDMAGYVGRAIIKQMSLTTNTDKEASR